LHGSPKPKPAQCSQCCWSQRPQTATIMLGLNLETRLKSRLLHNLHALLCGRVGL
jgi:hypothetical protein